jgi:L-threonylcarbamoyladenylate synthase
MSTEIIPIDPVNPEKTAVQKTVKVLSEGGIIVYPTDTLYGLGVSTAHNGAMDRLFMLKGRAKAKPLSLMVNNVQDISHVTGKLTSWERHVCHKLFPGKVTLILPVRKEVKIRHMENLPRIGFRLPDQEFCRQLSRLNQAPITTTSANISDHGNLESVRQINEVFNDQVDLILDAGPVASKRGSTVLDISFNPPVLIREGDLSRSVIEEKTGFAMSDQYPDKFSIIFVCSGNICRSPLAAAILRKLLLETAYKDVVRVESAGTLRLPSALADPEAEKVAQEMGTDIRDHLSRPVTPEIMLSSDLVICMALDHFKYLTSHFPYFREKICLLKQWGRETILTNPSIADPMGQDHEFFVRTYNESEQEIRRVLPLVKRRIDVFMRLYPDPGIF